MRILAVIFLSVWAFALSAQSFPSWERTTVNDFADLLPDAVDLDWHDRLSALEAETGIEFTIVTLPSQTPYAPDQTMEAFATALFNYWGVGKADRNNGIMLLVLPQDRTVRIELGAGYGRSWDGTARDIVERELLPEFRDGDYQAGIIKGSEAIIASIARPFAAGQPAPEEGGLHPAAVIIAPFIVVIGGLVIFGGKIIDRFRTCPGCQQSGGVRSSRRTLRAATYTRGGEVEVTRVCSRCGHSEQFTRQTARRTRSSSSGGSGGFGGGRSGGGGASGRW